MDLEMMKGKWRTGLIIGIFLVILLLFPFLTNKYWIRLFTGIFMYTTLAQATNILMGFSGLVPFGNVVFFGMGAYLTGISMVNWGFPFFVALIFGAAVCSAFASVIGYPILKLKGHYFAIATMGVSEAVKQIATNVKITRGGMGFDLPLISLPVETAYLFFYFLMFLAMMVVTFSAYWISKNRMGYALRAIMSNEEGGKSVGINTAYYKMGAWAISAFFTGIAGGIFAYWYAYIDPPSVFDIGIAVRFIIMLLLGGAGTIIGPFLGAFFIELLTETIWSKFLFLHLGVLGAIIVLVVIFMPKGFVWFYRQRFSLSALLENVRKGKL
jgi:branched-chain amino acid transport system permease protein